MALYPWINDVYCHADSILGELLLYIILSVGTFWKLLAGLSLWAHELYLAVLGLWGYQEQQLLHYALAQRYKQSRPACSLVRNNLVEEARFEAMPSFETQLIFFGSTFLLVHMMLVRYGFPPRILFSIVALPPVAAAALYITNNNTLEQISVGATIGVVMGLRNIILYHYFLKYHLEKLSMFKVMQWIMPVGRILPLHGATRDDYDTLMMKEALE
jgi:hypothetical protein